MAKYWRHSLHTLEGGSVQPPIEPLGPLHLMSRSRVEAVFRAQDRVTAMSRRIVASGGMRGAQGFRTPGTDPEVILNSHPAPEERRRIATGSVDLTPGCFLACSVVAVPSGETQLDPLPLTAGGPTGAIDIDCVWTDRAGATVSTSHRVDLLASVEDNGAAPTVFWAGLLHTGISAITPGPLNEIAELNRWSRHVNVRVQAYAVGGARPIDVVVFERPVAIAMEADDDGEEWCSHIFAPNTPAGGGAGVLEYPYQRFSETTPDGNPRGGTLHVLDVHHAQHIRLGPVLFSWSGAVELDDEEAVRITSSTLVELAGGGSTDFDVTEPGLAVGSGGYARRQASNSTFVLRDRVAAIPVLVRILASAAEDDALVRVMTRGDSYIDVTIPASASPVWVVESGWLEVGINPDDYARTVAQLFGSAGSNPDADLQVYSVTVHYAGGYQPAA